MNSRTSVLGFRSLTLSLMGAIVAVMLPVVALPLGACAALAGGVTRLVRGRNVVTTPLIISGIVTTLVAVAALFLVTAYDQTTIGQGQGPGPDRVLQPAADPGRLLSDAADLCSHRKTRYALVPQEP